MKKLLFALIIFLFSAGVSLAANTYSCTSLTGGGSGALDALDITGATTPNADNLAEGDCAIVSTISGTTVVHYLYIFDVDGTSAESSPTVIRPDDYATAGVWRLTVFPSQMISANVGSIITSTLGASYDTEAELTALFAGKADTTSVPLDSDFSYNGFLRRTGSGTYESCLDNFTGSAAPASATDDTTLGYCVGSRWFDTTNDKEYVCLDATDGAAVWTETTASGGSATAYDDIGDPDGAGSITMGSYNHDYVLTDGYSVRWGDGGTTNYIYVTNDGGTYKLKFAGNAVIEHGTFTLSDEAIHAQAGTSDDDTFGFAAYTGAAYVQLLRLYSDTGGSPYMHLGPPTNYWSVSYTGLLEANGTADIDLPAASVDAADIATTAIYVATASKTAAYTVGTDDAKESYGGVIYVSSAATVTLPAVAAGMSVTVITVGAIAVSVDTNASDRMVLDGVALDDGDKATNTSTTGDAIVCTYESADGWYCMSGSTDGDQWTDGGA